ncbi:MAG: UvrD-helicase domain-containing protein [Candidatus Aenigmarchaeota archaeon]|nr:UvrD-helicase domain-containing protein [Candidatus Aenigmarchaeota archaeon]
MLKISNGIMELDYILVLKALDEIPFGVGKKLLIDFLQGEENNESIRKNHLNQGDLFGKLNCSREKLTSMIDNLILNNMINLTSIKGNKFWKVMELSEKGKIEIDNPSLYKRKLAYGFKETKTEITDKEKTLFKALPFLDKFNDEQKKSIICKNSEILCIAGAGSGKTTVLTERINFLVNYCSQDPGKILAITFTKKARQEMLSRIPNSLISVETFNSFCEKNLRQHNNLIYSKPVKVITYRDKILILRKTLSSLKISMNHAIDIYFSEAQKRGKTEEKLANIFLNDVFFLRDYFKFKNAPIKIESFETTTEHENSLKMVLKICKYIESHMEKHGYRDFADQLIDTLSMFKKYPDLIPKFEHILVDEYQDVNSTQIKLIDQLSAVNLFCVGDPRQSIYGWRGSDIRYLLNFEEKYPQCEIITLTKNYRSTEHIVKLINNSIKNMGLADLKSNLKGKKDIQLLKFSSQDNEFKFVIEKIKSSKLPRNEIFVLARTNKLLNDISELMKQKKIEHVVKSDETRKTVFALEDEITLATIHSIKGMEAEMVFVIGCTPNNFPCKGSEHPVIDLVKIEEYDKEEEEKRLFYVAMSRAKQTLYLTHTKSHTYFITDWMLNFINEKDFQQKPTLKLNQSVKTPTKLRQSNNIPTKQNQLKNNLLKPNNTLTKFNQLNKTLTKLKNWRKEISKQSEIPAYCVMHDSTLMEILTKMPGSSSELQEIRGLGPVKITKYGDQILEIINEN